MLIAPNNPFKGRQHPGEVIILCVRWYLRYPLSYEHVAELLAERGVEVDASCIWRLSAGISEDQPIIDDSVRWRFWLHSGVDA